MFLDDTIPANASTNLANLKKMMTEYDMVSAEQLEVWIKTKTTFVDKLLGFINLKQASYPDYENALTLCGRLTCCEGEAVKILIDKGLMDYLADTLKLSESECPSLIRKALWALSNISSDSHENIESFVKSEAYELCKPLAAHSSDVLIRLNAMHIILNIIQFGPDQIVLDMERGNPIILQSILLALVSLSNNFDLLKNLLNSIDRIFELDTEYPAPEGAIAPVISRFLEKDGLTKLLEI